MKRVSVGLPDERVLAPIAGSAGCCDLEDAPLWKRGKQEFPLIHNILTGAMEEGQLTVFRYWLSRNYVWQRYRTGNPGPSLLMLVGPSGSGKTMIVDKIIGGLFRNTRKTFDDVGDVPAVVLVEYDISLLSGRELCKLTADIKKHAAGGRGPIVFETDCTEDALRLSDKLPPNFNQGVIQVKPRQWGDLSASFNQVIKNELPAFANNLWALSF